MMKKYPVPKLAKHTVEDMNRVAEKVAQHFPDKKFVVSVSGKKICGKKKSK